MRLPAPERTSNCRTWRPASRWCMPAAEEAMDATARLRRRHSSHHLPEDRHGPATQLAHRSRPDLPALGLPLPSDLRWLKILRNEIFPGAGDAEFIGSAINGGRVSSEIVMRRGRVGDPLESRCVPRIFPGYSSVLKAPEEIEQEDQLSCG